MTDNEQKSNASSAGGSAVVMVEKTTASRHKGFRPTELSADTPVELHHKRSRAPAVPSVAEEFKDSSENAEIREQKESQLAMASEKLKRITSNKSAKRATSPEAIAMVPIEVDVQKADIVSPAIQPIPPAVDPKSDIKDITDNDDNDSMADEIAELQNTESSHKEWDTANGSQKCVPENQNTEDIVPLPRTLANEIICKIDNENENKKEDHVVQESEAKIPLQRKLGSGTVNEGITSTKQLKKKEITWTQSTYQDKVHLQNLDTRSVAWMLDWKASVGPCFRKTLPYGEPSGITISLPKKSVKSLNENIKPSKSGGINITVSKRCLDTNAKLSSDYEMRIKTDRVVYPRPENNRHIEGENYANFFNNMKGKLDIWRGRIKHVLHL